MAKNWLRITIFSLIGLVFLFGAIYAGYWYGTQKDETADWQAYRNVELGYELKYPNGWYLDSSGSGGEDSIDIKNYLDSQITEEEAKKMSLNPDKISITIGVYKESIKGDQELLAWLKEKEHYASDVEGPPESVEEVIIAGKSGLKLNYPMAGEFYTFRSQEKVFYTWFNPDDSKFAYMFSQILSTFKSLD